MQRLGTSEPATLDPAGSRMGGTGLKHRRRHRHFGGPRVWSQLWGGGRSPGASPSPSRLGSHPVPARGGRGHLPEASQRRVKNPPLWVLNIHEKASPRPATHPHSKSLADFSLFQQGHSRRENPGLVIHCLLLANQKICKCIHNAERKCPGRSRGPEQLKDPTAKGCGRSSSGAIG